MLMVSTAGAQSPRNFMLTKPDIADELIISRLQNEYNLLVSFLTFLPLGADMGTAVYRVSADDGTVYFLKLRKGFDEISVTVPLFLKSQEIKENIAHLETKSEQGWSGSEKDSPFSIQNQRILERINRILA
jgi:spectinomycin phosphotransferase